VPGLPVPTVAPGYVVDDALDVPPSVLTVDLTVGVCVEVTGAFCEAHAVIHITLRQQPASKCIRRRRLMALIESLLSAALSFPAATMICPEVG
jgi:hypothetical protein